MGKNQAYKAMQRARVGSSSAVPEAAEDGMVDGSFHSPEWHAARLASLKTSHTITWEEFKKKQKEDELKKNEVDADKDRMMREYRAQLDAERARKLALGRNHSRHKSHHKRERKDRESNRSRKKKSTDSSSSSSSSSESWSSDDERESKRSMSRSRSSRSKKHRRHRSRAKRSSSDSEDNGGPVRLSKFFGTGKS